MGCGLRRQPVAQLVNRWLQKLKKYVIFQFYGGKTSVVMEKKPLVLIELFDFTSTKHF